ncbi:MAG: hypothetical protein Q4F43_04215 [Eubacteriales bacterium]|nr:hypothetical protein [Eubacteriales bacterium]
MFHKDARVTPGRKRPFSKGVLAAAVLLLLLIIFIFFYSLHMAAVNRVKVFLLDPYVSIKVEGADGYAIASPVFEDVRFQDDFTGFLKELDPGMDEEELKNLTQMAADSVTLELEVDAETPVEDLSDSAEKGEEQQDTSGEETKDGSPQTPESAEEQVPDPGIGNGDTITLRAGIRGDVQEELLKKGFPVAFDCDPVTLAVSGLPKADPYDLFADLTVSFSGYDGAGEAVLSYHGWYPFLFSMEAEGSLRNGDTITVHAAPSEGYDLDRIVEEFSIMPTSLTRQYTVSGLWVTPASTDLFTGETIEWLLAQGREAVSSLLEEEYQEDERIDSIEDEGLYFVYSASEENVENRLFCLYLIHYMNSAGDELDYYYYVQYDNIALDDTGSVVTELNVADYPKKSTVPLGELFGDGAEVSVPGFLNFRTLAGYETREQLVEKVITPLEADYEVTSLDF